MDTAVPVSARIWNYWLGGTGYFPVDKAVGEDDDRLAQDIVAMLRAALPAGGYLAINEAVGADPAQNAALDYYHQTGAVPYHVRRRDQILRFFDGLAAIPPGIVPIQEWRPEPDPFSSVPVPGAIGGVGKKH